MCAELRRASRLVGANPRGPVARVSLAVRGCLRGLGASPGGSVVVALSGGADSLALAAAAIDSGTRMGLDVRTVTVDHGLRPDSGHEARAVAELARSLGAVPRVVGVDAAAGADGPEGNARAARMEALRREASGSPVLLGHTMDDQAETVLLRLARGSGAGSLRAMSPRRADPDGTVWLRPLLGVRRADTAGACAQMGLVPHSDPTNDPDGPWRAADGSALRRAAVRHRALPALARALGADPVPALARSAAAAADDDEALASWAQRVRASETRGRGGARSIRVKALEGLPGAVRGRVLASFLRDAGVPGGSLAAGHVEAVDALVTAWRGQGPLSLPRVVVARSGRGERAVIEAGPLRSQ